MDVRILIAIMVSLIIIVQLLPSKFGQVNPRLSDHYNCPQNENVYPRGNVSGNYLGLNQQNIDKLTKRFDVPEQAAGRFIEDHYSN